MEETGILENPNLTSACYLALNQAHRGPYEKPRLPGRAQSLIDMVHLARALTTHRAAGRAEGRGIGGVGVKDLWRMHQLVHPLHCRFDVRRYSTSQISLMRSGY